MMTQPDIGLTIRPVKRTVSAFDVLVGVALSAFGVVLVSGAVNGNTKHAGAAASVMVLLMTLPVVWRRGYPVAVAAALAAGAILNPLLIGDMIRCGPALPALLLCAYSVGRKPVRLGWTATSFGLAFLLLSATVQCFTDPNLQGVVMVALAPLILGLYGTGRVIRSRTSLAAELERRNEQLRQQRALRADLAVRADRVRIAEGIDATLNAQITEIQAAAASGRQALDEESSPVALAAFGIIQERGRETLTQMRQVVGTLFEPDPIEPQPSLSQLDRLLSRAVPADIHLHISGQPRPLPAGIELSIYRTLEHLLEANSHLPDSRIDVNVDFATEALELTVRGPAPQAVDLQNALEAAQARVSVHHGSLTSDCLGGKWEATARLPF
jgi:signal transduction histidine kinase